jgi:hypothetical protein
VCRFLKIHYEPEKIARTKAYVRCKAGWTRRTASGSAYLPLGEIASVKRSFLDVE